MRPDDGSDPSPAARQARATELSLIMLLAWAGGLVSLLFVIWLAVVAFTFD